MQEASALSKVATAKQQSHIQCKAAVADLHDRLKQSQQLLDACACTDGSAAVKMEHLQDQLRAARYAICLLGTRC
jgi:mannitol-specific phosphotransferase system IIBC component